MPNKLTHHTRWLLVTFVICLLPFLLLQAGVSFSIQSNPLFTDNTDAALFNSHLLHTLLEWTAISIGTVTALTALLHYRIHRQVWLPIIAMAFLYAGLMDAFHTLSTTRSISANALFSELIPFTWVLSRIFNAVIVAVAVAIVLWLSRRSANKSTTSGGSNLLMVNLLFLTTITGLIYLTLTSDTLPQTIYPDAFLSRPLDALPLALFLFGGTLLWLFYKQSPSNLRFILLLSVMPQVFAQLHLIFGFERVFDDHFNIAHGLKIISYGCVLIGILLDLGRHQTKTADLHEGPRVNIFSGSDDQPMLEIGKATQPLSIQVPAAAFLLAVTVALVVSFTFYFESAQLIKKQEINQLRVESELVEPLLAGLYRQSSSDLFFLANTPPIQGLVKASNLEDSVNYMLWQGRLEQIFREMLKTKPIYSSISYTGVDDNGFELVTVMSNVGGVQSMPVSQRQQKGHSRHFKNTIKLTPGEIYFSEVELKRKNNQVAIPHQPIIQVATPIYNPASGDPFGIVVISVDFGAFMQILKGTDLSNVNLYLANQMGDFIYHPDQRLSFGFDLGERHLIQDYFPDLTQLVKKGIRAKGFSELLDIEDNQYPAYFKVIELNKYGNSHPLILLLQPRLSGANIQLQNFRNRSILIGISLSIIALALAVLASRRVAQPLMQLTDAVQEFEHSGQLPSLPTRSADEIGVLARNFHNLFVRIHHSLEAQQESANRLQGILSSAADAIITIDSQARISSFNTAAQSIFGYREADILGCNVSQLMPPHFANQHDQYIKQYLTTHLSRIIGVGRELTGLRKDGSTFIMHLAISEVDTAQGKIFTGIIRDISEQKQAELERNQSLSLLEATLEASENGILVTDTTGKTLRSNRRFAEMWCIAPELIDDKDEQAILEHILDQLVDPELFSQNTLALYADSVTEFFDVLTFKDGRVLERTSRPMLVNDQSSGRVWSFRDVTLSKQTEKALIEAKETAEKITRYKSEFLASMSHEIRTPMNGVLGMLGLLQQSKLNTEQKHHCQLAQSSAELLLVIINDILDFSKFEAGKLELELIEFNLRSQLGDFAESIGHRAQEKELELVLDVTDIKHSIVKGDPGRLRQILTNLVGNAIKFTPEGEIIIRARLVEEQNDHIRLYCAISDTGIGIETSKLDLLFDSFTQVDASTTREYGGTGLGLTIVKQLCELMGGGIEVSSEVGKGSCFEFNIALQSCHDSEPVMPKVDIKGVPILIVDDNSTNRAVLRGQLENWGAVVVGAQGGPTALDKMAQQLDDPINPVFKVAFIDMQMPGMDGMSLSKMIRNDARYDQTKMVMMTSMSSRGDARLFADAGFSAYFPKPTTTSDLFDSLSVVLADGQALAQAQPLVTRHYLKELKASEADRQTEKNASTEPTPLVFAQAPRLLLVEDNFINQAVATALLDNLGLSCDTAGNGIEALEMLNQAPQDKPYQLILMDCQMPEMDGYEATEQIRAGKGGVRHNKVTIIAMTANAMVGDRERCLDIGMDDYISKPIEPGILEQKLRQWLELS